MGEIHFYAPGLKRYQTTEFGNGEARSFVSVSVTGSECALACDHCNTKVLQGMIPLKSSARSSQSLYNLCVELADRGARGVLVSGGCDTQGRVPLLRHIPDLQRIRRELGLTIRVHPGLVTEELAHGLASVNVDGAMLDIIGAEETIRQVYHLDVEVEEYERSLERLARYGVSTIPHIIIGLHYGKFLGEWRALEMIAKHPPKTLVLVILMPLTGTAMAGVTPPPTDEIGEFFRLARRTLSDTPISLGCARPIGPQKAEIDRLAVEAGLNGIAYPAEGIVAYAEARGLTPRFHDACCGVNW
jgi:uncharacterized radical SAM superfamily protein